MSEDSIDNSFGAGCVGEAGEDVSASSDFSERSLYGVSGTDLDAMLNWAVEETKQKKLSRLTKVWLDAIVNVRKGSVRGEDLNLTI